MNVIIIEDEKPSARRLERMLERQQVTVSKMLHSVAEAIEWFKNNPRISNTIRERKFEYFSGKRQNLANALDKHIDHLNRQHKSQWPKYEKEYEDPLINKNVP